MARTERKINLLEQAWLATQQEYSTKNELDRAKGQYFQLARDFAPHLIEVLRATENRYADLLAANGRLVKERDRMIQNALDAQHEIQRLKDVLAKVLQSQEAR